MKKSIWKYVINPSILTIEMPKDAEILTVQQQNGEACIWALVNPDAEKEERVFEIFGTGHNILLGDYNEIRRRYINTFQLNGGALVFHLFERVN